MIHIACCSNEKLAPLFGVVVASVGINVKSDDVMMYLLHNGLKEKTIKRLHRIADRFHVGLQLMETVAMAPDLWYNDKHTLNRLEMPQGKYLNAGVIVMNLDYWRKHDVFNRLLDYIVLKGASLTYLDQDALNFILQNERRQLPVKYNVTPYYFHKNLDNYPKEMHEEIHEVRLNPTIFHFLGPIKPWSLGCYLPGKVLFLKYQRLSGWRHVVIQKFLCKRILYTIFPVLFKKAWENKTYINGWDSFFK